MKEEIEKLTQKVFSKTHDEISEASRTEVFYYILDCHRLIRALLTFRGMLS